jgi:ADP-L-glycero-D-manno-heptose 6-epimerase
MHDLSQGVVLVTGGAGFIGSALVWALNLRGVENAWVADFMQNESPKQRNLDSIRFDRLLEADALRELVRKNASELSEIRTILHLGACSSTTEFDLDYLEDNNFQYTRELAEWSLSRNIRFVYASSAATYGDGSSGMDDKNDDLERHRPLNPYGLSKHKFDLHARDQDMLRRCVGLKYFNVFGPNEDHKGDMRSVVHKAFGQIKDEGKVELFKSHRPDFADGEQKRDFLYVKDAVRMTLFLAENEQANGLFNLGFGQARTWKDLAASIFSALGKEPVIEFIDMPETIRDKYQYFTQADISKLREAGYRDNMFSLEEAVADYVRNYLEPDKRLGE